MSKGTEPTPIQLTPRFSLNGQQNLHRLQSQILQQGGTVETTIKFAAEADRIRVKPGASGQIEPLTSAAHAIGADIHWIN